VTGYPERLARLIAAGRTAQPGPEDRIDFSRRRGVPFWLPNRVARWAVSQFLHGEVSTAEACHALGARIGGPEAELLDIQRTDELRHASFYREYLAPLGGPLPVLPGLARAYGAASGPDVPIAGTLLAFHVLLEGESLGLQKQVSRWLPCPLFAEISARVARDEARHIAFGRLWLAEHLPAMSSDDHRRLHDWLRKLWFDAMNDVTGRLAPFDIVTGPKPWRRWVEDAWTEREADLRRLGLDTGVPRAGAA
jgi:hypothetical protein